MNRLIRSFAIFLMMSSIGLCTAASQTAKEPAPVPKKSQQAPTQTKAQQNEVSRIAIPPLPKFEPQQPRRIVLNNGMVVFLQENHELPVVGGTLRVRGGSRVEPKEKTGLMDIYGTVWRTGGSKQRTGDELDDFLEVRAAKIETGSSDDSTSISFNCLKGDFDQVFSAFRELTFEPAFRDDKIDLIKKQLFAAISRRNDDIDDIAGRESVKLAYGADNPYARIDEYATVLAVTRQDLLDWHARFMHPENAILGIYGDFDPAQMEAAIRKAFESWPKGTKATDPNIEFQPAKPGIYFIAKEDVDQSSVQLVTLGIRRDNPDYFAVSVMNEILSGGFASRLFSNLRTKQGLAYSVGGGVGSAWDHLGIQQYSIGTKSETTAKSIQSLKKELADLIAAPPTAEELKRAKDSILNSFVFNFDSKQKVLAEKMRYEFYGYPVDFLERYRAAIDKVAVADVLRVAQKYVHPDQLAILVVGNPGEIGNQLAALGAVTNIDITIPPPPGAPAAAGVKP
ncbi:MAG TPA: pitrilysin family protein [Terriglobales bacterium]|nr:pitrilysin family protein [Terriglobales bacterium]